MNTICNFASDCEMCTIAFGPAYRLVRGANILCKISGWFAQPLSIVDPRCIHRFRNDPQPPLHFISQHQTYIYIYIYIDVSLQHADIRICANHQFRPSRTTQCGTAIYRAKIAPPPPIRSFRAACRLSPDMHRLERPHAIAKPMQHNHYCHRSQPMGRILQLSSTTARSLDAPAHPATHPHLLQPQPHVVSHFCVFFFTFL